MVVDAIVVESPPVDGDGGMEVSIYQGSLLLDTVTVWRTGKTLAPEVLGEMAKGIVRALWMPIHATCKVDVRVSP